MYTIKPLIEDVSKALSLVNLFTILEHYKSCFKKMDLYRKKVVYKTREWKKLTFHKKTKSINDDK